MTASGGYKKDACIKLLKKLESGGLVSLPEKQEHAIKNKPENPISLTSRTAFNLILFVI